MNKKDLCKCVAKEANVSISEATKILAAFGKTIVSSLVKGEGVSIIGFGQFNVKRRAARAGVNPRTGEKIQIKASNAVSFKASKVLKAKCN